MRSGDEYRREAVAALRAGDGRLGHDWAKGWVGSGGGARTVEPWLVYLAAALLEGQRRIGVHAVDLALRHWIEDDFARAVLLYARGEAIRRQLGDPKTAQADLDAAAAHAPGWLRPALDAARAACADEARASRRRKPTVDPAPAFTGTETEVAPSQPDGRLANAPPGVWDEVLRVLTAADPRALSGRP